MCITVASPWISKVASTYQLRFSSPLLAAEWEAVLQHYANKHAPSLAETAKPAFQPQDTQIAGLVAIGASTEEALALLQATGGNDDLAANMFLNKVDRT